MRPRMLKCQWCNGEKKLKWADKKPTCSVCDGTGQIAPLTDDDKRLIQRGASAVMNAIAYDMPEHGEQMSARDWVEVIFDADHLAMFSHDRDENKRKRLRQLQRGLSLRGKTRATLHRWVREVV